MKHEMTAKKLYETSQNAGYDFTLDEVQDWLERQAVHQVHKPRPRFIPRVSFSSIQVPNEVHQADILYMPYDKVGHVTYLFCLNIVDIASRYKESVPIGSTSVKDRQGILTSRTIARAFEKVYDDTTCPLTWPKLLITDRGSEFKAIKKSRVSSRSSYPRDGPVGYEEEKLPPDISVRYLLEPNDLEGGRRRAGDMN
ncbi:unnamed protein product [Rhizophagus irregularis]|nr:unnamed protein product [Rhizophagus irregularis]